MFQQLFLIESKDLTFNKDTGYVLIAVLVFFEDLTAYLP